MSSLTKAQLSALETTERVASCFSLVGTIFIFVTFVSSPNFRRPINRLVFYASWGNTLCNIGTLISESGIRAGSTSHLCQFQAFLIQMFVPADAFWNLAMAVNVYMTLFRKYNAQQLKQLEWKYHMFCYGLPFVVAVSLLFVDTQQRGKAYGPAVLWCWVGEDWDFLRIALCYGPAWVCIIVAFAIYLLAGREIFDKRRELRAFKPADIQDDHYSYKTTHVDVISELKTMAPIHNVLNECCDPEGINRQGENPNSELYEPYSVSITSSPFSPAGNHRRPSVSHHSSGVSLQGRKKRVAMEANKAAWGYTKVALLFFVSLLVTWVPSSVNRVYALAHPDKTSIGLAYVAGIVLSLMGFWNSVIYIVTSRVACRELIVRIFSGKKSVPSSIAENPEVRSSYGTKGSGKRVSWGDDWERLADSRDPV